MSTNNPVMEIEDKFYKNSEESELDTEITVEADVTETDDQLPGQDDKIIDKPDDISEELVATGEDEETQYVEIDGKEISLDEIRQGLQSTFMQSDYTKKTTEHSQFAKKERDEIAVDRENLSKANEAVSVMQDTLSVLVAEDDSIDWAELKEDDPEEYIKLKEKADKRKEALTIVKAERETPIDDPAFIESERKSFWEANPNWLDKENKTTDSYTKDIALMNKYVTNAGFNSEEFNKMVTSRQLTTILKAAKYDELQEKSRKIKEKRDILPVVTKPKVKTNAQLKPMEEVFYGEK